MRYGKCDRIEELESAPEVMTQEAPCEAGLYEGKDGGGIVRTWKDGEDLLDAYLPHNPDEPTRFYRRVNHRAVES